MDRRRFDRAVELLSATFRDWNEDKAPRLAAALAFYTVFSLVPMLVLVIAVVGLVLGNDAGAREQVLAQVRTTVGPDGARLLQSAITASVSRNRGVLATVLGVLTLVAGATGVFQVLQASLDEIWEVARPKGGGLAAFVRDRLLSMTMVLGSAFLLLVSLVLSAALAFLVERFGGALAGAAIVGQVLNVVVSLVVVTLLFASVFKVLPHTNVAWHDVWVGAVATAVLFVIGKELLGLYLGSARIATAFGAAGSLVIILMWVYYSAQILFFGAEFTQVWARKRGSRLGETVAR